MEQKEIIDKFYIHGSTTLRSFLQVVANLSTDGLSHWVEKHNPLKGETKLYKLLNSKDPVTVKFLNQKVDFNKLKEYMEEIGLPFSFKEVPGGTNLYFKIKDQKLAQKALEKVLQSATNAPGELAKKVVQKPHSMTFEQRLKYAAEAKKYKGKLSNKDFLKPYEESFKPMKKGK